MKTEHTPGPWEYVPATVHHGPYVTSEFGSTICDCYVMSDPSSASVLNGGQSRPIAHMAEMADPNARLVAAAPELLEALNAMLDRYTDLVNCGDCGNWDPETEEPVIAARAAIAKAVPPLPAVEGM